MSTTPAKAQVSANVKSPAETPADQATTLGGIPPTKSVDQIDANAKPKAVPNTSR